MAKMKLGMQVGLGHGYMVLYGDSAPLPAKGHSPPPQFSAHICCGQMAGRIKMSRGRKVHGLDPGDIVVDGDTAPLPKMGHSPQFSAHVYCGQTVAHFSYC